MRHALATGVLLIAAALASASEGALSVPICPTLLAALPVSVLDTAEVSERRFELRGCHGVDTSFQILAFEAGKPAPNLVLPVPGKRPRILIHHFNVLIVQPPGGTSATVYVVYFAKGKVQNPIIQETRGVVSARLEEPRNLVVVDIPGAQFPHRAVAARRYRLPLEH